MITATKPPRFLIIQTAFIGDVILTTALLEQIRAVQPDARLDVLVRKGNESLLAGHPLLNEVLTWDKKNAKYRDLWRILTFVRAQQYDVVLNLQRFGATGLLTALSNARLTVGFDKNPFSRFFTYRVDHRYEPGVHEVDRNAGLLAPLGVKGPRTRPKLYPSSDDYAVARSYQNKPYVCIAPTTVWFTKQYPPERWAELIQVLPIDLTVYLLGAPTDLALCETIRTLSGQEGRVVNLAGRMNLMRSAVLHAGAVMNYVNDSAALHLCSAMNAPTTAVFCSTVPQFGFGPLADKSRVVQTPEPLSCKPCGVHGRTSCPLEHFRCAWGIRVSDLSLGDVH
ncbi:glycosyltransferase family 9 protein [Spirosoma utsteinense]|uniref:Heptosyltransferase-2 n=1 Tax=Spirosoma utsteinense TaxID=2585773 RepID=A0ABR6WAW8_9BACT|nr:glycosyltransferase family 9 protein [Spirosoma utsteinense]MBC3787864.1 heptosyltransferase-2 [Spirosoma utsteinense]MBC3793652.1 heptosyltransferase-2 [Spirosoma utsteinense]